MWGRWRRLTHPHASPLPAAADIPSHLAKEASVYGIARPSATACTIWYSGSSFSGPASLSNEQKTQSIKMIAAKADLPYTTVLHRLNAGKTIEEAIQKERASERPIIIENKRYSSIVDAARVYGIAAKRIAWRIDNGWSPEEAVGLRKRATKKQPSRRGKEITIQEQKFESIAAAAKAFQVSRALLNSRLSKGLTPEQALELEPFPSWFTPGRGQAARARGEARLRKDKETGFRTCGRCKQEKPLSEFNQSKGSSLSYRCKACTALALIRCRYGISDDDFHALRKEQNGKCAICDCDLGLGDKTVSRRQTVAVDHCHKTGAVRGLLCNCCNSGLGSLGDSVKRLKRAIQYLERASQGSPALVARYGTAGTGRTPASPSLT